MRSLYVVGGVLDLILWYALALDTKAKLAGDLVVFSKAFDADAVNQINRIGICLGLKPLGYPSKNELLREVSCRAYARVHLSHLSDPFSCEILGACSRSKVTVLFEGLAAYLPPVRVHGMISRIDSYVHCGVTLLPPDYIAKKLIYNLGSDAFVSSVDFIRSFLFGEDGVNLSVSSDCVILVGQHFYRHKVISWDDEFALYSSYIEREVRSGNRVIWKEHPRSTNPFAGKLKLIYGDQLELLESYSSIVPIELMYKELLGCAKVAGFCSNALFNLRDFYGFDCESIVDADSIAHFSFGKIERLAFIQLLGWSYLEGEGNLDVSILLSAVGYGNLLSPRSPAISDFDQTSRSCVKPKSVVRFFCRHINKLLKRWRLKVVYN